MGIRALAFQSIVLQRSSSAEPVDIVLARQVERHFRRISGHDEGTICKWVDLAGKHVVTKRLTMDCYYALLSSLALPTLNRFPINSRSMVSMVYFVKISDLHTSLALFSPPKSLYFSGFYTIFQQLTLSTCFALGGIQVK
jgi:hypothetical protein